MRLFYVSNHALDAAARTAKGVICSMKFHERIFRAVCKASVYILISAFCVGIVLAVYVVFIEDPTFVICSAAIITVAILVIKGSIYISEDCEKRIKRIEKEIEQLEREMKQQTDEVKKE
jgi:hypothetical protein